MARPGHIRARISSSRAMRASVGGWVENRFASDRAACRPLNGFTMNLKPSSQV